MKINELKCDGCPAFYLRTKDQLRKIKQWEKLRENAIEAIGMIRLYILCESIPANRFFYDLDTVYENKGLRFNIKEELELKSDKDVLRYFDRKGIVLIDCALCPLHRLTSQLTKQTAASICLKNNNYNFLLKNPEAPIVTIFPKNRGYSPIEFPLLEARKKAEFPFTDLTGLRQVIEELTK